jgi:hypothetical protein
MSSVFSFAAIRNKLRLVYEIAFCLVLFANLVFVFFDASYLARIPYANFTFRDLYLQYVPPVALAAGEERSIPNYYDAVKGIKPHRLTSAYLEEFDRLRALLTEPSPAARGPEIQAALAGLRERSVEMVDADPFALASKSGTLEVIKNRMREHMRSESGKDSFRDFFSAANFAPERAAGELAFFETRIRPLIERNYFRWIGEDGEPTDWFYLYDLWFVLFFWFDFLTRWAAAIVRGEYRKWYVFAVRNWYEVFNLLPVQHATYVRLLRIIPFLYRMRRNGFLPDSGLAPQIIHENAGIIAEEISGMVMVNILKQSKSMLENRGLKELATLSDEGVLDELQDFLHTQVELISRKVVPEIQPRIADLVEHSIEGSMRDYLALPAGLALRPMLQNVQRHVRQGLETGLASEEGVQQMAGIMRTFVDAFLLELSKEENVRILERELGKLLEGMQGQVRLTVQ